MATKKQTKANQNNVSNVETVENRIAMDKKLPVLDKLMLLIQKNLEIENAKSCQTITPCLIGGTGVGKTSMVKQIGEKLGLDVEVILLHSMLSEEVLGLPRVFEKDGNITTNWTLPGWFDAQKPKLYFFDELDKVKDEELGAILTLLADKTIRGVRLPEGSVIVLAMQPIDIEAWESTETGRALIARLNFIATNGEAIDYLSNKYKIDLSWFPKPSKIKIPRLEIPAPRQVEYCINLFNLLSTSQQQYFKDLVSGIISEQYVEPLVESIMKQWKLNPENFIRVLKEEPNLVFNLSIPELIPLGGQLLEILHPRDYLRLEYKIWSEGSEDDWTQYHQNRIDYWYKKWKELGDGAEVEIFGDATYEDLVKAVEEHTEFLKKEKERLGKEKSKKQSGED